MSRWKTPGKLFSNSNLIICFNKKKKKKNKTKSGCSMYGEKEEEMNKEK